MGPNFDKIVKELTERWNRMTLADLRRIAQAEDTGIAFEALREDGGRRMVMFVCVTARGQILQLEQVLNFAGEGRAEDWNTLTLAELFSRTAGSDGLSCEDLRDEDGRRIALALIATAPRSIEILGTLFELPK